MYKNYLLTFVFLLSCLFSGGTNADDCGSFKGYISDEIPVLGPMNNVRLQHCVSIYSHLHQSAYRACVAHICGAWMYTNNSSDLIRNGYVDSLLIDIAWEQIKHFDTLHVQLNAVIDRLNTMTNELAQSRVESVAYRELVNKQVLDAKQEMMNSIKNIPLDVVKDETAYNFLRAKLEKDLADAFAPK